MDPRQPVEFEPVALRRNRRRIDPAMVVAALVVAALAVAIVKPWGGDVAETAVADTSRPSPAAEASSWPNGNDRPVPAVEIVARPR